MRYITTSWDDGHPSDERLAQLLEKYGLKGTFYIPQVNPGHRVMKENEIAALSRNFEIGGHTLNHINLKKASPHQVRNEVQGSYDWLHSLTAEEPVSFCPPFGQYSAANLSIIYETGFRVVRTTQLLSTSARPGLLHTTLQMYPHSGLTYFKHLMKHGRMTNLGTWSRSNFTGDIFRLLDHYLEFIMLHGGCLHLWGHSWEIDNHNDWNRLENIFSRISRLQGFIYAENRDLEKQYTVK